MNSRRIIRLRFPSNPEIVFPKPRTIQPDRRSCGIFAAAYASIILHGYDPSKYPLFLRYLLPNSNEDETTVLRDHMATMLMDNRVDLFPSQLLDGCNKIRTPNRLLEDQEIDLFINMVNDVIPGGGKMVSILNTTYPMFYAQDADVEDDVQILYEGPLHNLEVDSMAEMEPTDEDYDRALVTGHYICIQHKPNEKKLYVYDSLQHGTFCEYLM